MFSQTDKEEKIEKKRCITIGVLQGGGSILGADIEGLVYKNLGLQVGVGFVGFGGGINWHFSPEIRSSFVSLQYWHQGFDQSYTQSMAGPNIVYRGKRWLTCQLGIGFALEKGPAYPTKVTQTPVMLMYAIGIYIPQ